MDSALVFTGETTAEMLKLAKNQEKPTYAVESILDLLPAL